MKTLLKRLLWRAGLFHLERYLRNRRTLTVVMFHRVLPRDGEAWENSEQEYAVDLEDFAFCLEFFKRYYNVVSLAQVRRAADGGEPLPANALLITFDDGWQDNVLHAEPLLKHNGMRATVFINVDAIRQKGLRWWQDALVEVAAKRPEALAELSADASFYGASSALLQIELDERLHSLAPWIAYHPQTRQMLDADGLSKLDPTTWDIGSHGLTHVPMTYAKDIDAEISGSARHLGDWCGSAIDALAFPHGRYNSEIVEYCRAHGYALVFSSDACLNEADRLAVPVLGRIHVPSAALRLNTGARSPLALALFLWRRATMSPIART